MVEFINNIDPKYNGTNVDMIDVSNILFHIKTTDIKDVILNGVRIDGDEPNISIDKIAQSVEIYPYTHEEYYNIDIKPIDGYSNMRITVSVEDIDRLCLSIKVDYFPYDKNDVINYLKNSNENKYPKYPKNKY